MSADINANERDRDIYPFLSDMSAVRRRARQRIQDCALAPEQEADVETVVCLLNEALAIEFLCISRYRQHCLLADGADAAAVKSGFFKHAQEEQGHAEQIAERIVQLGGAPNFADAGAQSDPQRVDLEGESLLDLLEEDLIAERIAIQSYQEILQYLGSKDATTRQLFEAILAGEQAQAEELATLRGSMLREYRHSATAA
jgi:bacterioferritin